MFLTASWETPVVCANPQTEEEMMGVAEEEEGEGRGPGGRLADTFVFHLAGGGVWAASTVGGFHCFEEDLHVHLGVEFPL